MGRNDLKNGEIFLYLHPIIDINHILQKHKHYEQTNHIATSR